MKFSSQSSRYALALGAATMIYDLKQDAFANGSNRLVKKLQIIESNSTIVLV